MPLDDETAELLQRIADFAFWGPHGPEGGNSPDAPTFTHPDATFRIGWIVAELCKVDIHPAPRPVPPSAA